MTRITDDELREGARFLRGDPEGSSIRLLRRVADWIDHQVRVREANRAKDGNKRRAKADEKHEAGSAVAEKS